MEDIYEKILWDGYGLRYRGGSRTRTGLVCRTDAGLRELKKPRGNAENLRLAYDVKARLRQNGFPSVSRLYPAQDGEPFYKKDGILYTLEDPMPPVPLPEETAADFAKGAETLGRLHAAAKGLQSPHARWEKNRLPGLYARRKSELAKIKRRIDHKSGYDPIDLLILGYYKPCMEQTTAAEELLESGGYAALAERAEKDGGFCHNAYKGENLRLDDSGGVFVAGFDRCISEVPLADLAAYLRRYMKKTDGNGGGVEKMLAAYGRYCPLSKPDITLLEGMNLYPEKFLRLVNQYYNRRRACVSPAMQERLTAAAGEQENGRRLREILQKL